MHIFRDPFVGHRPVASTTGNGFVDCEFVDDSPDLIKFFMRPSQPGPEAIRDTDVLVVGVFARRRTAAARARQDDHLVEFLPPVPLEEC